MHSRQELEAGNRKNAYWLASKLRFSSRSICLEMSVPMVVWALLYQLAIKEMPYRLPIGQSNGGNSWFFPS